MNPSEGREVVIVEAVRTAVGRGHPDKGIYRDVHPNALLGHVFTALFDRSGVDPALVNDVLVGCVQQIGEQGSNIARNAWLEVGLPVEVPATTIDRQCGSSQQAVNFAASLIASGAQDVVVAGGVEHMGHIPFSLGEEVQDRYGHAITPELRERHGLIEKHNLVGQGPAAEQIARHWDLSREQLEELAVTSHARAAAATEAGLFDREIAPVTVGGTTHTADQGIRPETTSATLGNLKPVFEEEGRLTAGTSSQVSDGAAALLLMSAAKAAELGVKPRARVVAHDAIGADPVMMLTGPIPLTRRMLDKQGLTVDDIGVFEVNEAFASVLGAWMKELQPDPARVNPRGGAMALGHPLGATGARLLTTLLHEMEDDDAARGLVAMCCGGGLATGTMLELV